MGGPTASERAVLALFLALSHIPKFALARVAIPSHVDRQDLLAEANKALFETLVRHADKPFTDLERLSYVRCRGAIRDALRSSPMIRGARRRGVRAQMISTENLPSETGFVRVTPEPILVLSKIRRAIEALSERERRVLIGRAVYETDVIELAREYSVSEARISQIYVAAIHKVREALK